MRTAVSVPDDLVAEVDQLARRSGRSRSAIYVAALREYVAHTAAGAGLDAVMEALNGPTRDGFVSTAAERTLANTDW